MTDSLRRKRNLADSFIPCDSVSMEFLLHIIIFMAVQEMTSKFSNKDIEFARQ